MVAQNLELADDHLSHLRKSLKKCWDTTPRISSLKVTKSGLKKSQSDLLKALHQQNANEYPSSRRGRIFNNKSSIDTKLSKLCNLGLDTLSSNLDTKFVSCKAYQHSEDLYCTLKTSVGQLVNTNCTKPNPDSFTPLAPPSKIQSDVKKFNYSMLQFSHKIEIICM